MRIWALAVIVTLSGCRRKHPPVQVEDPTPVAVAPADEPPTAQAPAPYEDPFPATPSGHAPSDAELRKKLDPLFPQIGKCISDAGPVKAPEKYLQLRFSLSPQTGGLLGAELEGHDAARACVMEVLRQLKFEPWPGAVDVVTMPLTHEGKPVSESAFATDAGK